MIDKIRIKNLVTIFGNLSSYMTISNLYKSKANGVDEIVFSLEDPNFTLDFIEYFLKLVELKEVLPDQFLEKSLIYFIIKKEWNIILQLAGKINIKYQAIYKSVYYYYVKQFDFFLDYIHGTKFDKLHSIQQYLYLDYLIVTKSPLAILGKGILSIPRTLYNNKSFFLDLSKILINQNMIGTLYFHIEQSEAIGIFHPEMDEIRKLTKFLCSITEKNNKKLENDVKSIKDEDLKKYLQNNPMPLDLNRIKKNIFFGKQTDFIIQPSPLFNYFQAKYFILSNNYQLAKKGLMNFIISDPGCEIYYSLLSYIYSFENDEKKALKSYEIHKKYFLPSRESRENFIKGFYKLHNNELCRELLEQFKEPLPPIIAEIRQSLEKKQTNN